MVNKINKNKQEVLELFMNIKKTTANDEMARCRKFLGTFQVNQETELIMGEGYEKGQDEEESGEGDLAADKFKEIEKNRNLGASRRKFKKLTLNLGIIMFELLLLIIIMEGYLILCYMLSQIFFKQAIALAEELSLLADRYASDTLLLLMEKYLYI